MASQHKAPTQVSIAPLEEKSAFEEAVHRYWKPAALVAVAIAAVIVFTQFRSEQERSDADESWNALAAEVDVDRVILGEGLPEPDALAPVVDALHGTDSGPWAAILEARSLIEAGRLDDARAAVNQLQADFPEHPLVNAAYRDGGEESTATETLPGRLLASIEARAASDSNRDAVLAMPELPAGSPRVRITTDRGELVVGLYPGRAPRHVENFLKLCREGFYDGTRFHRVLKDQLIQGGDPNTRDLESAEWGQGGPGYTLPPEITDAWHFRGALAAAKKPGEVESSGSQFYIAAQDLHQYDKQYTVFGRVVEGMDLVDALVAEVPEGSDRPEDPPIVESTEVLEG